MTSLTAAGCYLCAAPQSKGTKILVCCSLHSPNPLDVESSQTYPCERKKSCISNEIERIITDGKSYSDCLVPDTPDVPFLHVTSSESILSEGKRLGILSESTCGSIMLLQKEETNRFRIKTEAASANELRHVETSWSTLSEPLQSGHYYHFMNRFFVTWKLNREITYESLVKKIDLHQNTKCNICSICKVGQDSVASVRHMIDRDWLYLAKLSRGQAFGDCQEDISHEVDDRTEKRYSCSEYVRVSAHRAIWALKFIPVAARRGLPVLVNSQGLLLSIPSISFEYCPNLLASAVFKPRVPLGGGHSSFI